MIFTNPFESSGNWYKANLHCHSIVSDGEASPQERIEQYRDAGYHILALTDHEIACDLAGKIGPEFLVIGGMESHPPCPFGGDMYHLLCLNVPKNFSLPEHTNAETRISLVKHAGGIVFMAHPYWCGHNLNHLMAVEGYTGIEVYNGTAEKIGKPISAVHWDDLLDAGRFVSAIAVDDTHRGRDIFMGWTMIRARSLDTPSVVEALATGAFYASSGPVIEDVRVKGAKIVVQCSPVAQINFISRRSHGLRVYAEDGGFITDAECSIRDILKYVRIEVVDQTGRRAWTNPMVF
jgi:hypothetical protein